MKYLLDTDHLTFYQRGTGREYSQIVHRMLVLPRDDVGCAIISLQEQFRGCHAYLAKARDERALLRGYEALTRVLDSYKAVAVAPVDRLAYLEFIRLQTAKVRVSTMDLRIAATAISLGAVVVTRNTVDFSRVPGLQMEEWTL